MSEPREQFNITIPDVDYHNQEFDIETTEKQRKRIHDLISGPGGIMEMKQTIANLEEKNQRLVTMIKSIDAASFPGTYFIHGAVGKTDPNGMPEKLLVVPSYGYDYSYVYTRTDKTTGPEW